MSKRKDTQARRDAYLLGHYETMTYQQIARHLQCPITTINSAAKRLGLPLGLPQRMRRIKAMLPPEGILSGPAPTFYEMREYRDAKPALDPFMQVFRP